MPHANIWIRKEYQEVWNELENKSDFVNAMLAEHEAVIPALPKESIHEPIKKNPSPSVGLKKVVIEPSKRAVFEDLKKIPGVITADKVKYCEHGQPKGSCLWKGCKYA